MFTDYQLSKKSRPVFGNESVTEEVVVDGGSSFWNYKKQRQWGLLKKKNLQVSPLKLNRKYMSHCSSLSVTKYSPFVLTDIVQHGENTFLYTFKFVSPRPCSLVLQPGQHMYLRGDKITEKGWLERPYNVIQSQKSCSCMEVLIVLTPTGSLTKFIQNWHVGRITWWRGPFAECPLKEDTQRLSLFANGAGISPMIATIRHLLGDSDPDDPSDICIKLFFCTSNHCNIYFRKEMNKYMKYSNFSYNIFLSEQQCEFVRLCKEKIYTEMLNQNHLKRYIMSIDHDDCQFLICGDPNFKKFVSEKLECFGIDKDSIHIF